MKLGLKIILPLLLLAVIISGSLSYLLYNLTQQGQTLAAANTKIQKFNGLVEEINRQQYRAEFDVLSYRFKQNKEYLDEIIQSDLEIARILDEMSTFVTTPKGRGLVKVYIDVKLDVAKTRYELINAIQNDDAENIRLYFSKWSLQIQNVRAALSDINAFNINSIEGTVLSANQQRGTIVNVIIVLTFIFVFSIILMYGFFRWYVIRPIGALAKATEEISRADFTTTMTTALNAHSNDEIGQLTSSFKTMAVKLRASYASLEQKVKERTAQLQESEERMDMALAAAKMGAWDLDLIKDRAERNLQHDQIFGYKKLLPQWSAKIFSEHVIPEDRPHSQECFEEAFKTGIFFIQCRIQWHDKSIHWIEARGRVYYDGTKKPIRMVGTILNVDRERAVDQAKTEFVSLASHQLRTPLSAVNWYTEMLMAGDAGKINKEQKKYLDEIYAGNQRMVELVNALLNVSRLELGTLVAEPVLTDLAKRADDVIKEQQSAIIARKTKFKAELAKDIPFVFLDPKLIRMVFQNLLSNAIKYTPEEGSVLFSLKLSEDKQSVHVTVADNGYGITKSQQDRVFTKLFRADNVREKDTEGTGLGLYIVKSVVEHSGGAIRFESEENKGTIFYVTFPIKGMKKKEGTKAIT